MREIVEIAQKDNFIIDTILINKMKKLQIGVIGTFADKKISSELMELARLVGQEIAKSGNILFLDQN